MKLTLDQVIEALRTVQDPAFKKDVIALGMVKDLKIEGDEVSFRLAPPTPGRSISAAMEASLQTVLKEKGALSVKIHNDAKAQQAAQAKAGVPGVRHIIAVSSGKGGVGKSTVSTNLATALALTGAKVGLLDTDIYGPNIPTMMGIDGVPQARMDEKRGELIQPLEAHGVKVMSMGLLTRGDQPAVWRGPMLHSVVHQFLMKVDWGTLDYLIVDMPPGTGDVQLSLTQLVPLSGTVIVTTPQEVSSQDVRKAILMFEKVGVPILGVVENMSYFVCDGCDKRHSIFGAGAGSLLSEKFRVPLLAQLPLVPQACQSGDKGLPVVKDQPQSALGKAFLELAIKVQQATREERSAEPEIQGF